MSRILVRFDWDCGRMGDITGIFVSTKEELEKGIGKQVYFGEILGKHSEIYGTLDDEDIEILSQDQDFIEKFSEIVGGVGYNPFQYIEEDE